MAIGPTELRRFEPPTRATIVLPPAPSRGPIVRPEDWSAGDRQVAKYFWTSTDKDSDAWTCPDSDVARVINFGMKAKPVPHGTPYGHGHLTIHVDRVPMIIVMQLLRARVQNPSGDTVDWMPNVSQKSGRYTAFEMGGGIEEAFHLFYHADLRTQVGRPGAYTYEPMTYPVTADIIRDFDELYTLALKIYLRNLERGLSNEQARFGLPQSTLTRLYLTASFRNWFNWLVQRDDDHAQKETRDIAVQTDAIMRQVAPVTYGLWESNGRRII